MITLAAAIAGPFLMIAQRTASGATQVDETASTIKRYTGYAQNMNLGSMMAVQADPTDETSQCYTSTMATNAQLAYMTDINNYTNLQFTEAQLVELAQIVQIKYMTQIEDCGLGELQIIIDESMNRTPNLSSLGVSVVTQLALGWSSKDTSIYKAYFKIVDGYNAGNFYEVGQGSLLLISQAVKFTAPSASINAAPIQ